jgi:hypothetical protein
MTMNIAEIIAATKTVSDSTEIVFINNATRAETSNVSYSAHAFRGYHNKIAFDHATGLEPMRAATWREILEDSIGEEQEWAGNMGRGPVYTTTEETEVAITEHYRDSNGEIVAWFATPERLMFFTGALSY